MTYLTWFLLTVFIYLFMKRIAEWNMFTINDTLPPSTGVHKNKRNELCGLININYRSNINIQIYINNIIYSSDLY